jgi:phosphoenolpyruvate synthase/pyruvate phosphate dikinase
MFTKPFQQLSKHDANIAGGKGASLGEMITSGIPVPDGFVVLSTTFDKFLEITDINTEIDAILNKVNHSEVHTVENASKQIQALILSAKMPKDIAKEIKTEFNKLNCKYVAVRSSATAEDSASAAWAGQLDSFLNTTEETLLENVQRCFASLFTPRAIFYRFEKELHNQTISVAVVVQRMVNSKVSGIAFSVHPVTEDRNQIIIEAGFGLGEAIVSGQITPDSYVVTKDNLNIIDKNVYTQERGIFRDDKKGGNEWRNIPEATAKEQCLSDKQIIELSNLIIKIENHYNFPCDIEWAMEDDIFYIVQSRPITTLKEVSIENKKNKQVFEKMYTRDTSLIIQQAWFEVFYSGLKSIGINNDYDTAVIHFMNNGGIEIWENLNCTQIFLDKLLEKNISDPFFYEREVNEYFKSLSFCESIWEEESTADLKELKKIVKVIFKAMTGFIVFYYSGYDDRTPKAIRNRALKMRDSDTFFASNDRFIRESLKRIYPHLDGYESCILKDEIERPPSLDILKLRRDKFVIKGNVYSSVETIEDFAKNNPEFSFEFEKPEIKGSDILGQTAYRGKVRGFVKILRRNDQVDEVSEGDILVSPMTTPEHVSAMNKASAFVTDEGGITCHAAIVAREMRKPCVIGTKVATQALKDGDKVEVDADNGVVRILNKKSDDKLRLYNELINSLGGHEMFTFSGPYSNLAIAGTAWSNKKYLKKYFTESKAFNALSLIKGKEIFCSINNYCYRHYAVEYLKKFISKKISLEEIEQNYNLLDKEISNFYQKEIINPSQVIKKSYDLLVHLVAATVYIELFDKGVAEEVLGRKIEDDIWLKVANPDFEHFEERWSRLIKKSKSYQEVDFVFMDYYFLPSEKELEKKWGIEKKRKKKEKNNKGFVMDGEPWMRFVQFAIKLRDIRKDPIAKLQTLICKSVRMLYPGVDDSLLAHISCLEIINNKLPNVQELEKRRDNGYVLLVRGNDTYEYDYDSYHEIKKLVNRVDDDITVIQGISASPGFYKGIVRIILDPNNSKNFKKGDILVTGMTRPDFVPLMKKAGAIVTSEGGVTCHAAIVSRELGVPCVIGAKIAVKVLKDGDEVEVDADNGVVNILNSKGKNKSDSNKKNNLKLLFDRDKIYPYPWYFAEQCVTGDIESVFGKKVSRTILEIRRGHIYSYVDIDSFNDIGEFLFNKVKDDKIFYKKIETMVLSTGDDLIEFCEKLKDINYQKISNKKLLELFNTYSKKLRKMRTWGWVPPLIDGAEIPFLSNYIQEKLRQFLLKKGKEKKTAEYYSVLSSSEKMSEVQLEELGRLKLIKKIKDDDRFLFELLKRDQEGFYLQIKNNPTLFNLTRKHTEKFEWLPYAYVGPKMDIRGTIKLMHDSAINKKATEKQIKDIEDHFKNIKISKNKIINKINLTSELKYLFKMSSFFMYLKDLRKGLYQKSYVAMDFVMEEIAKRANVSLDEVKFLTPEDIKLILINNRDFSKIARERFEYCVCLNQNGKTLIYNGKKAKDILKKETFSDKIDRDTKEFSGLIAYSGKARGLAKIVLTTKDLDKIKEGEILVSSSTNPDLIIAMKKASAFVTDMGGVTSHAAIVSREMKKPCVVGTKIATKVIEDGDEVEVDADNGVVRILNKNKL